MATESQNRRLWRDVILFDGLETRAEPMAVIVRGDRVETVVPSKALDDRTLEGVALAGEGGVMTPGLVDCHTHLVFGGSRADEFEQRLEGASYETIARQGGGILRTVRDTRAAPETALFDAARERLDAMIRDGLTTVEIKSGYGLNRNDELKILRVARRLGEVLPVRIRTTLLAAHAVPPEFQGDSDGYIERVCRDIIPAAAAEGLVDAVDVFCEKIAFSLAQCERVFEAAERHGLAIKAHAEQLSNQGGAALAASRGALSADHLEYLNEAGIAAMRDAGTVAVLLPGAFYTLGESRLPPVDALRRQGVPMAVASDANPGSSPLFLPSLILNMACTLFRLTPREALVGMTAHGARALGALDFGHVAEGAIADLCLWDVATPAELAYAVQPGRLRQRIFGGEVTHG